MQTNDILKMIQQYQSEGKDIDALSAAVQSEMTAGKTPLGLNQWELSDKPLMSEFNSDNQIIDEKLRELSANKANTASPELTGTPTAPTAAQTVNNSQIATTGFVHTALTTKPIRSAFKYGSGFSQYSSESCYFITKDNTVALTVYAKKSTDIANGDLIATLPVDVAPANFIRIPCILTNSTYVNYGYGMILINSDGTIIVNCPSSSIPGLSIVTAGTVYSK